MSEDNRCIYLNMVITSLWTTAWILFLVVGDKFMNLDLWQAILVAAIPALISGMITYCISRKGKLSSIDQKLEDINKQFGKNEDKTLSARINDNFENVTKQLGTEYYKNQSLSSQHERICRVISNKAKEQTHMINEQTELISSIKKKITYKEEREYALQKAMSEKTLQAKEVAENFIYLSQKLGEQEYENEELTKALEQKNNEAEQLNKKIAILEQQITNMEQKLEEMQAKKDNGIHCSFGPKL